MPSKLNKVTKHVTKKKGSKISSLHENSRDAIRLRRAGARDDRVSRLHALRGKANRPWLERIMFLQENLPDTLHPLDIEETRSLVSDYLARHDEELDQLKAERRPGRPASNRQTLIEQQKQLEKSELESGFWIPNLQDEETLLKLDKWDGNWLGLGNLRYVRINDKGEVTQSQFPPRGAS